MLRIAQRVAGRRFLEARDRDDIAGESLVDVLTRVGVHEEHTADLFLLVLHRVQIAALFELARIDTREGEGAHERIVHDLERQRRERRGIRRRALVRRLAVELDALDRRHVERSEEHTSELQSLMRISYAVFCLKKKK